MTAGFTVDVSALHSLAQNLHGVQAQAVRVAQSTGNADVSDLAWGQIGQLTRGVFGEVLGRSQGGFDELQERLDRAAQQLLQAADVYQGVDHEVAERITAILAEPDTPRRADRRR